MSVSDLNGILGAVYDPANQALRVSAGGVGSGDAAIDDLTDVTTSAPAIGQTLVWNGTAWVNGPLDLADGDARTGTLPLGNGGTGATTASGARTALELGDAATKNVGTAAGTVAAGDDSRITGAATAANLTSHTSATGASVHGLGSASVKDAPASGDATSGQVVLGSDTRLTDARTPTTHAHASTDISDFGEAVADRIGGVLVAGSNVTITVSDANDTVTIASTASASGDVTGPSSSVDNEIALFSGTGGKTIKRATTTGLLKATSGVISAAVAGTDYQAADADLTAIAGLSGVRGDIIYRDASQWQRLAKGTSGQLLSIGANDPAWSGQFARVLYHDATGASVTNTTTETSLLSATYTLAANTLSNVGDCLQVWASGTFLNNSGANRTFNLQIGPDAATAPTFLSPVFSAVLNERAWVLDIRIRVDVAGANPTLVYDGYITMTNQSPTSLEPLASLSGYMIARSSGTWATNSNQTFDLRVALSATSTSLTMTCDSFTLCFVPKAI